VQGRWERQGKRETVGERLHTHTHTHTHTHKSGEMERKKAVCEFDGKFENHRNIGKHTDIEDGKETDRDTHRRRRESE
jgi:hypothetical protein